jgi:hypothetical protein
MRAAIMPFSRTTSRLDRAKSRGQPLLPDDQAE